MSNSKDTEDTDTAIEQIGKNADTLALELTTEIISAYVGNHTVPTGKLPKLIASVHNALHGNIPQTRTTTKATITAQAAPEAKSQPAVPINQSVSDDYIICLEDGKRFKSLKRHLQTSFGMTSEQYRERWNLPADYPMVAPSYSRQRSSLAKKNGLGRTAARRTEA